MKNMRITTAQLAEICGVSQGTVDRALHDRGGISEKTKKIIIETAEEYGFRYIKGNTKCSRNSKLIGVIIFNLYNEYFSQILMELERYCYKIGYHITVMFTNYDKRVEIDCIQQMYQMGVKGVIICPVNCSNKFSKYVKDFSFPVVAIGNQVNDLPYVGIHDEKAMETLVKEYIHDEKKQYHKIIYFSPAINYEDAVAQQKRYQGFLKGIEGTKEYEIVTEIEDLQHEYTESTVIFCSTDYYALKVYYRVQGADVIGFDNISLLNDYEIPVDSLGYSYELICEVAVESILSGKKEDCIVPFFIKKR